jgi:hypothetical protein
VYPVDACGGDLVLGLQARGDKVPKARVQDPLGDEDDHTLAVARRGEAAVAVAATALLELFVQVAHSVAAGDLRCRVVRLPLGVIGFVFAGVKSLW